MTHKTHEFPIRVYIEDTDRNGIVFHPNFLKFAERGRTEMFRGFGVDLAALLKNKHICFVVKNLQIDYCAPALLNDVLTVKTEVKEIKSASIIFQQSIIKDAKSIVELQVTIAVLDNGKLSPVRIPEEIKTLFKR